MKHHIKNYVYSVLGADRSYKIDAADFFLAIIVLPIYLPCYFIAKWLNS